MKGHACISHTNVTHDPTSRLQSSDELHSYVRTYIHTFIRTYICTYIHLYIRGHFRSLRGAAVPR